MAIFYVTYDLRSPGRDYPRISARLTQLGAKRVLESVWAVKGEYSAMDLHRDLVGYIDGNDRLLVVQNLTSVWTSNIMADPNTL